jgi:hypothetical protein
MTRFLFPGTREDAPMISSDPDLLFLTRIKIRIYLQHIGSEEFLYFDMKYEAQARRRRGQCLSPHTAPAFCDNDVLPV